MSKELKKEERKKINGGVKKDGFTYGNDTAKIKSMRKIGMKFNCGALSGMDVLKSQIVEDDTDVSCGLGEGDLDASSYTTVKN